MKKEKLMLVQAYIAERKEHRQMQKLVDDVNTIISKSKMTVEKWAYIHDIKISTLTNWRQERHIASKRIIRDLLSKFPELEYDFEIRERAKVKNR